MPRSKSVLKRQRQTERHRVRNLSVRSELKTFEKRARAGGGAEELKEFQRRLDKAAGRGVIHPNKAARKKARIAKAAAKGGG